MAQNHPNDNIYSILGKLDALKPTPQEKHDATVKQIYESVEAQGSILKGLRDVNPVEQRLARQFAESKTDEAIRIVGNPKGPVGHYSQAKYTPKDGTPDSQAHRDTTAAMAKSARAAGSKLPLNKTTEPSGKLAPGGYNAMTKGVTPVKTSTEECAMCEAGTCAEHTVEENYSVTKGPDRYGRSYYNDPDFTGDDAPKRVINKGVKGRPKKADSEKSAANLPQFGKKWNDPFNRTPGTPPKGIKGTVIKPMGEHLDTLGKKLHRMVESVNFIEMMRDHDMTLDEMLNELHGDLDHYKQTGECSDKLNAFLKIHNHSKKQIADEATNNQIANEPDPWAAVDMGHKAGDVVYYRNRAGTVDRCEGSKCFVHLANGDMDVWPTLELSDKKQGMLDVLKKDASEIGKGLKGFFTGGAEPTNTFEDQELNELARLAGLSVSETAGAKTEGNKFTKGLEDDDVKVGDKIPGTNATKTKDIDESMGECGTSAPTDNINVSTNMSSNGDKSVTVTANGQQAEALMQMLTLAGMGTGNRDTAVVVAEPSQEIADEGIEVDDTDADPVNAPDEQYFSMKGSTMGPGEGDPGEKNMYGGAGDNKMTQPPKRPAQPVMALEARLAAEYESIKKATK